MAILDGVPALLSGINNVFFVDLQLTKNIPNFISNQFILENAVQWGIYEPAKPPKPPLKQTQAKLVLEVDGFLDFELSNASQVAGYRIEEGKFASYNKVDSPYNANIVLVKNGDEETLRKFLLDLDQISNDIKLYDIVTPQQVYSNANVVQYSYRRTAQEGYNTLYIYLSFVQILSTLELQFSNATKTTSGQAITNNGTVSAK